jgi:hypothetical protein
MSTDSHREYAENATLAFMNTNFPGVPVKFQNVDFSQPQTTWVAFYLIDGKSFMCNLGTRKVDRHVGLLQLDVMVPAKAGTKAAYAIGEAWGKAFRDQDVGLSDGAVAKSKTYDVTDMGSHNGFYRVAFRVAYWRDEPPQ